MTMKNHVHFNIIITNELTTYLMFEVNLLRYVRLLLMCVYIYKDFEHLTVIIFIPINLNMCFGSLKNSIETYGINIERLLVHT